MAFVANPGTRIELGGKTYVLPPLSIGQMEQLTPEDLAAIGEGQSHGKLKMVGDLVHAALLRNYPEITRDDVVRNLDAANMMEIVGALMRISNFTRNETAEEPPPGEA